VIVGGCRWAPAITFKMADVRALLKAKREEKRISHPFAAYSQTGQLRCTACSTIVKHASAWNGHLGSKSHRTNAARVKEEEKRQEALEDGNRPGKRKAADGNISPPGEVSKKARLNNEDQQQQPTALSNAPATAFPSDFFSDPSRSIALGEAGSDEEEGDKDTPPSAAAIPPQSNLDLEWARFQETVINVPMEADARETFERATIFAEPQLSNEIPEGFPSSVIPESNVEPGVEATTAPKDEVEARRKRENEEKELIMDRLLDEERAQEEADERVNALKARLDLLRQKRMAAKTTRAK
jgi:zinc finger protein 830